MELRTAALKALQVAEPAAKAAAARALAGPGGALDPALLLHPQGPLPGRTERPVLVPVQQVPRRSPFTPEGRAALLHAVAHIELNAIKTVYKEDLAVNRSLSSHRGPIRERRVLAPHIRSAKRTRCAGLSDGTNTTGSVLMNKTPHI